MRDRVEVFRQIGVNNVRVAPAHKPVHFLDCIDRVTTRAISISAVLKIRLEDRFQHDLCGSNATLGGQLSVASLSSGIEATKTILVVDDDAAVLKTTLRLLDSLGYSIDPALSGEEALQMLDSHSEIDLILADYAMPTMSGIELAKAIRTTRPALPVILTGYGNREVMEGLSETRILQKPYTEDELILRIRRAFNER